jgi:alkylhydroperoxidase family enzyme
MTYPDLETLPAELREAVLSRGGANVYHMLMHSRGMAMGFCAFADTVFDGCSLPPDLREIAILRVGHRYGSAYEVHQHEALSRLLKIPEAVFAACALDADVAALSDGQQAIIGWTDMILRDHRLHGDELVRAHAQLGTEQLADLVLVVGFYQLVCNFLNTFPIEIEDYNTFEKAREYRIAAKGN